MPPIYIYITVLALIAAKLIYDSTIGKSEAERTLTELSDRQAAITAIFEKVCELSKNLNPREEMAEQAKLFNDIAELHHEIINKINQCDVLEKVFQKQVQKLPKHYSGKLIGKYRKIAKSWTNATEIQTHRAMHTVTTVRFIKNNYSLQILPILELAKKSIANGMIIQYLDGRTIDKEQVIHDIEKLHLNQKLKATLPPKQKTKVVKI